MSADAPSFPPVGWVTNHEAALMLGVKVSTLTCNAWRWRLRCGKRVPTPGGGCGNIYPLEEIQRVQQARAAAAEPRTPEGFVDRDEACRMFGVTRVVWSAWINQGKVRFGQVVASPVGGRRKLYALSDLEKLKEEIFGDDKLYKGKGADQQWHLPAGFIGREEAWAKFGVEIRTWDRWEREGKVTCGQRVPGGPKLYKVEDIERMLDEYGTYGPPYPDPDRPGAYRVPLSGRDIKRREAIIDADALLLIEGGWCSYSGINREGGSVVFASPSVPPQPLRRLILGVTEPGLVVRHANRDPLDCRRANLVVRTIKQCARNARKRRMINGRPPTSQFKGVQWEKQSKRWLASIRADGKNRRLGRFGDEVAAAQAYDEAAQLWFGEHAWLNFPDGIDAWLERAAAAAA